jgi:hypothetical protein
MADSAKQSQFVAPLVGRGAKTGDVVPNKAKLGRDGVSGRKATWCARRSHDRASRAKQSQLRGMGLHGNPDERRHSPYSAKQSQSGPPAGRRPIAGVQNKAKSGRLRKTGVWARRGSRAVVPMRAGKVLHLAGPPGRIFGFCTCRVDVFAYWDSRSGVKSGYAGN